MRGSLPEEFHFRSQDAGSHGGLRTIKEPELAFQKFSKAAQRKKRLEEGR